MARQIETELQLSRPVQSPAQELILNLYRTEQHLTAALQAVLRPVELQLDEFNVLRIVRGAGAAGHPRAEIERRMLHSADRLLAILHKLKTRGLVEGTLRLTATPAGLALLASVDAPFQAAIDERVGWIPADRLRVVIEVLESIRTGRPGAAAP